MSTASNEVPEQRVQSVCAVPCVGSMAWMVTAVAVAASSRPGLHPRGSSFSGCLRPVALAMDDQLRFPIEGAAAVPAGMTLLAGVGLAMDDQL